MKSLAGMLRPKFEMVEDTLDRHLSGYDIARWTNPKGGYFISLYVEKGCARRVYQLARSVGVALTPAGATYPYGRDPDDSNIRIAPTFPTLEALGGALDVFVVVVRLVSAQLAREARA